jgi:TonB family protein
MAPILKELESPAANTSASSPAAPQAKSTNDAPPRPQPVALEIPVTINGARTIDGSDKRVPFSESTQTVLVFPHGAVIRIATPLNSGQLVFLTNEKTKKEVVCQVVKSKSSGGTGAYVELQFTEPSLAFWGLQIPGGSTGSPVTPAAPRPVAPAPSATVASKPPAPPAPVAAKPPVVSKPVAPTPISAPAAKPVMPPAPPFVIPPAPASFVPPAPPAVAPQVVLAPESAKHPSSTDISPRISDAAEILSPAAQPPVAQVPPVRDYSKQIDALFAVPQAPAASVSEPAAPPVGPSTDDLKLQAARLQEQLGSLLFTEKPSASPEAPPAPTGPVTPEMMASELSAKLADIIQAGPAAAAPKDPKSVVPIRKPASTPLGAEEEVKIPSWLGPIQNAEVVIESDAAEGKAEHGVSLNSEESFDALVLDSASQPHSVAFGGQMLSDSLVSATDAPSTGSKKNLFIGLAAAGLLLVGGGAWYYHHNQSSSATAASAHVDSNKPSSELVPASNSPAAPPVSIPAANNLNSSPATSSRPSVNSAPAPVSAPAVSAPQPKNSNSTPKNNDDSVEPAAPVKSSLGKVHLAAPVVNRNADSQTDSDAFASIDTKSTPAVGDPLASAAHRNGPAAPLAVGGDIKQAQLLKSVAPEYPVLAKAQHVSGRVQIEAVVDASGNVAAAKVLSGPALLHQAALQAVKQWRYSPAILDGQPTITHVVVNMDFRNQ